MDNMITKKSWEEFRETGLLWFINTILHLHGWSIIIQKDEPNGPITDVYPARVKFRGFSEECNSRNYIKVTRNLKENIDELLEEVES